MQPIVHLAVGYLCYAAVARWRYERVPRDAPAAVAIVGAALPDLLDKPLAALGVVPVGRTVGHSLLFAIPLLAAVWLLARASERETLALAFAVGYLSHLASDVPWHLLSGDYDELGFLLWPVTHMPAYTGVKPLASVAGLEVTTLWLEAVIFLAGVALWWHDGRPGLARFWR
ncbi:metal-dependent hydrolase [Natronobiforma cellulositropha]|uniref:metal-dependent hydrolase n=1 Tax=Natronobiforma cellulositropha TaxID=1679076 RepID=UPI0021D579E6|nr:metal-dependent hydrolase [Natronobiforma cellulositropha]